ncbi:MAG: hypothetical protein K0S30_1790 [Clostridia bacterium]|jgi:peptidoglycan hydrolase CwlO-like protein|nr:hypothetical protein [Clostridia bacterium]
MTYSSNLGRGRKKNTFSIIAITVMIIGLMTTVLTIGGFFYVKKGIENNIMRIEEVKKDNINLQEEIELAKKNVEVYENSLEDLNEQMQQFEPVVIPESMVVQ